LTSDQEFSRDVGFHVTKTGLPDGIFSNQKSQFGKLLEGLAMEDVGIFIAIWYILW
jgi:hypothetical protein